MSNVFQNHVHSPMLKEYSEQLGGGKKNTAYECIHSNHLVLHESLSLLALVSGSIFSIHESIRHCLWRSKPGNLTYI